MAKKLVEAAAANQNVVRRVPAATEVGEVGGRREGAAARRHLLKAEPT